MLKLGSLLDRLERRLRMSSSGYRRWPLLVNVAVLLMVTIVMALLLGPIAGGLTPLDGVAPKDRSAALNATRQMLLAGSAGALAIGGLAFTARTFFLSRRGQMADRYGKAMSQLASDQMLERIGGIYALERLMIESNQNHDTVVEALAAYVREHAQLRRDEAQAAASDGHFAGPKPRTDVQAAVTVLGRRPNRTERNALDLSGTDLSGADLRAARLAGATLDRSRLQRVNLSGGDLTGASLMAADLTDALLVASQLQGAFLTAATLRSACMAEADLRRASLVAATLHGAILEHAMLQGALFTPPDAEGLTADQLRIAQTDSHTELPKSMG
ncbi:MAG TPA: pentapeptide repeat-containing protein [Brevundimonas sp.]|nr:pentapeptide repeat-containing protein [Brevundimonas sp.]